MPAAANRRQHMIDPDNSATVTRPFVHLHIHTEYSIVDSTVRIPALMAQCKAWQMPAVALTDQSNLFGLVKFYRKALAAGVKPLIGLDLRVKSDDDRPYSMLLPVPRPSRVTET